MGGTKAFVEMMKSCNATRPRAVTALDSYDTRSNFQITMFLLIDRWVAHYFIVIGPHLYLIQDE